MMLMVTNKVDAQVLALSDFEAWCKLAVIGLTVSIDKILKHIFAKNIFLVINVKLSHDFIIFVSLCA